MTRASPSQAIIDCHQSTTAMVIDTKSHAWESKPFCEKIKCISKWRTTDNVVKNDNLVVSSKWLKNFDKFSLYSAAPITPSSMPGSLKMFSGSHQHVHYAMQTLVQTSPWLTSKRYYCSIPDITHRECTLACTTAVLRQYKNFQPVINWLHQNLHSKPGNHCFLVVSYYIKLDKGIHS